MNKLGIILLTLLFPISLWAQSNTYSYVYIEGDKETSFYVKLEGKMMPRLGQNYCILSNLDAGVTNIEILFQQNKYPAQQFKINVPINGTRSFLLRKITDDQFALYDLLNGYSIPNGNRAEDDKLSAVITSTQQVSNQQNVLAQNNNTSNSDDELPAFNPSKKETEKPAKEPRVKEEKEPKVKKEKEPKEKKEKDLNIFKTKENNKTQVEEEPKKESTFIDDIVFDSNQEKTQSSTGDKTGNEFTANIPPNSDCSSAMSNEEFEVFATKYLDRQDDDAKLKFLKKNRKSCFSSEQVRILAKNIKSTSARYEAAEILYAQTSDQPQYYSKLEELFRTEFFKAKLRKLTE